MTGRLGTDELPAAHPIAGFLPALFLDDDFTCRFVSGLDVVLAPAFAALDNLAAYLDPALAPADFTSWLAQWVGLVVDEHWPLEQLREAVATAVASYRRRGTVAGLTDLIALHTGGEVEVVDSGGVSVSEVPGGALPGNAEARVVVRVRVAEVSSVDAGHVARLVALCAPAHVACSVEVVGS